MFDHSYCYLGYETEEKVKEVDQEFMNKDVVIENVKVHIKPVWQGMCHNTWPAITISHNVKSSGSHNMNILIYVLHEVIIKTQREISIKTILIRNIAETIPW